jgi:hypothetical protein
MIGYLWRHRKTRKMKFLGFVITIIVASSAFFTLIALGVGSLTLLKKAKKDEEHVKLD